MLDSGAFSFFGGAKTDLNEYVDKYIKFINDYDVKLFFELDIYSLIGKDKTDLINQKIRKETGKKPIPVFHYFLGVDFYKQICEEYDYIAIGASGRHDSKWTRETPEKLRKLIDYAHSKKVKVHGLGYTSLKMLLGKKMPFDSVDSTSWMSGHRFGTVQEWNGTSFTNSKAPEGQRANTHKIAQHNFEAWIKFNNFAERNL
tara:strand:- start:132 stop:734 length:603 start_codon:yes stop_codon:yes gene_type:complete